MSERTGLGPLELAVLRSVSATAGPAGRHALTTTMLEHLEAAEGIGPAYGLTVAADLGSSWRVHLCLLDLEGNWGGVGRAPPADPWYTQVRLSPLGELALALRGASGWAGADRAGGRFALPWRQSAVAGQ